MGGAYIDVMLEFIFNPIVLAIVFMIIAGFICSLFKNDSETSEGCLNAAGIIALIIAIIAYIIFEWNAA